MNPADIAAHVERLQSRAAELEQKLADPAIYQNSAELKSVSQEHRKLNGLFENFKRWQKVIDQISENEQLIAAESDPEMRELAELDLAALRDEVMLLENKVRQALLPPDENETWYKIQEVYVGVTRIAELT